MARLSDTPILARQIKPFSQRSSFVCPACPQAVDKVCPLDVRREGRYQVITQKA
jgi:hypothetical protein